jgi:putative colanic acid biosynthesis acetyltransferase WcaF
MRLDAYSLGDYSPGASKTKQILWFFIGSPLVRSYLLPFSSLKIEILRVFGASIGKGVRVKPDVRIKFPWRLSVGDHSWIGESVWIDNLANVDIGSHCCISQGVYLCTGNHDWSAENFDLRTEGIVLEDGSWLAAKSMVAPGVRVSEGAVLGMGSLATDDLEANGVFQGNPAKKIGTRN